MNTIPLPAATRARLEQWVRQRDELQALIDVTVQASREALGVPDGYTLTALETGFVAPEPMQGPARAYGDDAESGGGDGLAATG